MPATVPRQVFAARSFPHRYLICCGLGCLMLLGTLVTTAGCKPKADVDSKAASPPKVSSVPLRVVSAGGDGFDQRLALAWKSVSEQPVEVTAVASDQVLEASKKADVLIFANRQMGDLQAAAVLTPIPEALWGAEGLNTGTLLPALSADVLRWGTEVCSMPLGANYPAVWFSGDVKISGKPSWDEWQQAIAGLPPGEVAEPLADGWAAIAFLWRAATLTREMWLFDRQSMVAQVATEPYVKALQNLVQDAKRYPKQPLSPTEIWAGLESGSLKLAIAWPTTEPSSAATEEGADGLVLSLANFPKSDLVFLGDWTASDGQPQPPMLAPNGLSVGITSACRQTQVARTFINWLGTAEAISALRGRENLVVLNRVNQSAANVEPELGQDANLAAMPNYAHPNYAAYDEYLTKILEQAVVRPSLRIPGADQYLDILDREVLAAIAGEKTPEEALQEVSVQWEATTERLGRRGQINSWRLSQGMRER